MEGGHSSKLFSIENRVNEQTINCEKDVYTYNDLIVFSYQVEINLVPVPFDDSATFKIKGKKYTAKTNKKGVATVTIKNLKVGKYRIASSYGGCTIKNIIKIKK